MEKPTTTTMSLIGVRAGQHTVSFENANFGYLSTITELIPSSDCDCNAEIAWLC